MRYLLLTSMLLVGLTGCQSEPADLETAQFKPVELDAASTTDVVPTQPDAALTEELSEPAVAAVSAEPQPVEVELIAGDPDSRMAPRYSPQGTQLTLTPAEVPAELGVDPLKAEVVLGPDESPTTTTLVLTRKAAGEPYSRLIPDTNQDGQFLETSIETVPSESRGNLWSSFSADLPVRYGTDSPPENYPVNLWVVVASADERPAVIRYSRRGFRSGDVSAGSHKATIFLSDANNDGVLTKDDWWELKPLDETNDTMNPRGVSDFHWLGDTAWQLELTSLSGSLGRLVPFDPGISREDDELSRDPYGADRAAERAAAPVAFRDDADAAIAAAAEQKIACFLKFETDWCVPCKQMTELVFTAKEVVNASEGIICVRIDGDERKDLASRYTVRAYPTGILLAADGTEAGRFEGYRSVKDTADFLRGNRTAPAAP